MKNVTMISRRSFLKAAMAAIRPFLHWHSPAAAAPLPAPWLHLPLPLLPQRRAVRPFKVGIVNYVDHASLNQIVESVESRLDELGAEKGVTFDYADYYANAQADQSNLNQIGADLVGDGVDVIVAVATPTAATMLAAVEDTDIPVVYSAVTDPAAARL